MSAPSSPAFLSSSKSGPRQRAEPTVPESPSQLIERLERDLALARAQVAELQRRMEGETGYLRQMQKEGQALRLLTGDSPTRVGGGFLLFCGLGILHAILFGPRGPVEFIGV